MPHDVFISHSSKDKPTADAVCHYLESAGIRCWIAPRDVMPGGDWAESIVEAVANCRLMVLVFSSNANDSTQINREINIAAEEHIPIVPFRIEDVRPSKRLRYYLGTPHWLDALTPPIESHLDKLVECVLRLAPVGDSAPVVTDPIDQTRVEHGGTPQTVSLDSNALGPSISVYSEVLEKRPDVETPSAKEAENDRASQKAVESESSIPGHVLIVVGFSLLVNGLFSALLPLMLELARGDAPGSNRIDFSAANVILIVGGTACILLGRRLMPKASSGMDHIKAGLGTALVLTALFGPVKSSVTEHSGFVYFELMSTVWGILVIGLAMAVSGVVLIAPFFVSRLYPERYGDSRSLISFLRGGGPSLLFAAVGALFFSTILPLHEDVRYGFTFVMTLTALVGSLFGFALRGILGLAITAAAAGFVGLAYVMLFSPLTELGFLAKQHVPQVVIYGVVFASVGWTFSFLTRKVEDYVRNRRRRISRAGDSTNKS